jgi:single-stranded-DNA-specific exonuclease
VQVKLKDVNVAQMAAIADALRVRPATARCLAARGITTSDAAKSFLEPRLAGLRPPQGLAGMSDAVERIVHAIAKGQRIGVFGDYDVDGVTTAALLTTFLRSVGAQVVPAVASREAGYGFTMQAAQSFISQGCELVVTGDCGTSDIMSIQHLAAANIDTVIVDHHTVPSGESKHPAFALLNPFRADSTFPFRGLASVGLAFYLAASLRTALRDCGHFRARATGDEPDVRQLLDLVALGTIADLVPLTDENRVLTALGLRQIAQNPRPGIAALMAAAGITDPSTIDSQAVAWKLAPRLNAPGRLGGAAPSLALLMSIHADAALHASTVEAANVERRSLQADVMAAVQAQLGDDDPGPAVVISGEGWPAGVVGIVAAKLVDKYQRPAFVVAIDPSTGEGRGSARTSGGVDLYQALLGSKQHLTRFGGHAAAAGFALHRDDVAALRISLGEQVSRLAAGSGPVQTHTLADAEVRLDDIDERLATELTALGPFGQLNPAPKLLLRDVTVQTLRKVGDGSHIKLILTDGNTAGSARVERSAIGFSMGDKPIVQGQRVDALFVPVVSTWQGRQRVELSLHDICSASV